MADDDPLPGPDPEASEEAISQALRRSLVVLVGLCAVAATAVWWLQRRPEPRATAVEPIASPSRSGSSERIGGRPRVSLK